MVLDSRYAYTAAANPILRWLTDPGERVPMHIRAALLGELFTAPTAVLMGVLNGLLLNAIALYLHSGAIFLSFLVANVLLAVVRIVVAQTTARAASTGLPTRTDLALTTAILWCGLQGATAFMAMFAGGAVLQALFATTIMALIVPICVRNYPAPRLAVLLVALCALPFDAGAALSGQPWLLVLIPQTPMLLVASLTLTSRFQRMAVATLQAEHDSQNLASRDPLTGLFNRLGLAQFTDSLPLAALDRFTIFYLDLDGFKKVNDTLGHHAGDKLLQQVADRLRASTRASDIVARMGGDEFVIIALGMPPSESGNFADAMIRRITDQPYTLDGRGQTRIGISIGFACAPEDGTSMAELSRKADGALYLSKGAGKGVHHRWT